MEQKPIRIKRNGFYGKLPENTKLVARPSRWQNPFKVSEYGREKALELFKEHLTRKISSGELDVEELRGWNLACYCELNEACHADILLDLANK